MPYAIMGLTSIVMFFMATTVPDVRLGVVGYILSAFWFLTFAIGLRKHLSDD